MYDFFSFLCILLLLLSRIFYNTTYSARQLMCSKVKHSSALSLLCNFLRRPRRRRFNVRYPNVIRKMSPQGHEYVNSLRDSFQSMSSRSTSSYDPPPVIIIYHYSAKLLSFFFFFFSVFGRRETNNGLCFDAYTTRTLFSRALLLMRS